MDFKITKKQKEVLYILAKKSDTKLVFSEPSYNNGFKPYWLCDEAKDDDDNYYLLKKVSLATVDALKKLGMVRIKFKGNVPETATITTSGRNYLKSLDTPTEDRLDLDKLHRINQLVYRPMQKETKRK